MAEKPKKIREFSAPQGRSGKRTVRVRELEPNEPLPRGAEVVDDKTEVHDWQPEGK